MDVDFDADDFFSQFEQSKKPEPEKVSKPAAAAEPVQEEEKKVSAPAIQ